MRVKVAVISDIHGNRWALEAVLKDISERGIENIVNLGDSLYGPLDPSKTAEILMKEKIISISGNQDRNIVDSLNQIDVHPTMKYVIDSLSTDSVEWLKSLSKTFIFQEDFFLCHGTPNDDHKYLIEEVSKYNVNIKPSSELEKELKYIKQQVILCGHSHTSRIIYLSSDKLIINPGSVGLQAFDDELPYCHVMESGSPHARYSIITKENINVKVENIALPYCFEEAAEYAIRRNRPDWQRALLLGRI
jgi:putative phosphoesterase